MSVPYETAVVEDLATGYGTKAVTMPGGGSATGTKVNHGTIPAPTTSVGWIHVYPPQSYLGKGVCYKPDGSEVSTVGSTTSGLQEALNAMASGYNLWVHGGGDLNQGNLGGAAVYNVADGVTLDVPAVQGKSIVWDAVTLNFAGTDATPCLRFDSFMMLTWTMRGCQLGTARTGDLCLFDPRNAVPIDAQIVMIDSTVQMCAVAKPLAAGGNAVRFRANTGNIANCRFQFNEINGGATGIQIDKPTGSFAVAYNEFVCHHVHGQVGTSPIVLVGDSAGAANAAIRDNYWNLHILKDATGGGDAFYTRETRGRGFIAPVGFSNSFYDVRFEDQASKCRFMLASDKNAADYAAVVRDASTAADNWVDGVRPYRVAMTLSGSPYVYPASTDYGHLAREHAFVVQGGTVSKIETSYDGSTWDDTGVTQGEFRHRPGRKHRVTYSVAPTMTAIL